jgi:pyruvate ferredoxin oxidoreductase delta subunit
MDKKNWKQIPIGGLIIEPGNSVGYKTGDWRSFRPIRDDKKCTHCMMCWLYCPDMCMIVKEGKIDYTDYDYCKGCGICAEVCPVKCIQMKEEDEFR